jgi:membrane protease YdiL (CAAX protease family)
MNIIDFIKRHLLGTYLAILFVWIAFWAIAAISVVPSNLANGVADIPSILLVTLLIGSPSFVAVVLTGIVEGKPGIRRLLAGFGKWRVSPIWYAVALFTPAIVGNLAFLFQGLLGGPSSRDLIARLPAALPWFVFAPLMEEIGWRGFLQPRLMEKYKTWIASILVGIAWGTWHLSLNAIGFSHYGNLALPMMILAGPIQLTAIAIIIGWVYERTKGSLLLAGILHGSVSTSAALFGPPNPTSIQDFRMMLISTLLFWLVSVGVTVSQARTSSTHSVSRQFLPKGDS